jgi:hypothetical protein
MGFGSEDSIALDFFNIVGGSGCKKKKDLKHILSFSGQYESIVEARKTTH